MNQKRQPKGTPVGGQFAQDRKPSGGDLTEDGVGSIEIGTGPGRIREWFKDGEFVPPPIGTEINIAEARALPSYVEVMATFEPTGDREFRLMARDMPRYTSSEHPTDSRVARRFTNLDTGFEVFVGGEDGQTNLTKIRVVSHG